MEFFAAKLCSARSPVRSFQRRAVALAAALVVAIPVSFAGLAIESRSPLTYPGPCGLRASAEGEKLPDPWWKIEEEDRLMGPRMPFRVDRVSPPPVEQLGYQVFDSKTSRGDVITVKGSDSPMVVSRVRFLYDFVGGRYRIRMKVLEVQTPQRYNINERLAEMVPRDVPVPQRPKPSGGTPDKTRT